MKKILKIFILFIAFCGFTKVVFAETFRKGEYIINEYIDRVDNGKVYYANAQYYYDSSGNLVYCIEPFDTLDPGSEYKEYVGDFTQYNKLSEDAKRKIFLIAYYGYGYGNHNTTKWYVVTQLLIWRVIAGEKNVYFTDTLNGNKIDKYDNEINEILGYVDIHDQIPSFVKTYKVNFNEDFHLKELNEEYEIVFSTYDYSLDNGFYTRNVTSDGSIQFRRKSQARQMTAALFENSKSQDLIRPGNLINPIYEINVQINKGKIALEIVPDDSVYTVESDFTNTCYEILNEQGDTIDNVCTGKDDKYYLSQDLPFGKYTVRQYKHGIGYREDNQVYEVELNDENNPASLYLENFLIRNTIEITKYACKDDLCSFEANANFEIYDKNNSLVKTLSTNELGYTSIVLGYGTFTIKQVGGITDYTLADEYQEKIVDEVSPHKKELFNYYQIQDEEPKIEEPQVEILPPDTATSFTYFTPFLLVAALFLKRIIK